MVVVSILSGGTLCPHSGWWFPPFASRQLAPRTHEPGALWQTSCLVGGAFVQLAIDDLGAGVQWVDALEGAGYQVHWARSEGSQPDEAADPRPDVVILQAGLAAVDIRECTEAWRRQVPPPALLIAGAGGDAEMAAAKVRARFLPLGVDMAELPRRVERALVMRYAGQLSPGFAVGLLGLPASLGPDETAIAVARHAHKAEIQVVREALRPYTDYYAAATPRLAELRELRALELPAVELSKRLDGSRTVRSLIESADDIGHGLDMARAAQHLWAFACLQSLSLGREPIDDATPERRAVVSLRHHLRARRQRLRKGAATYYDVLELPPTAAHADVDIAARLLGLRYGPVAFEAVDLGDLRELAEPLWKQVVSAHKTLRDEQRRTRYLDYLRDKGTDLQKTWKQEGCDPKAAEIDFELGQRALIDGDVFQAVSRFASAARRNPALSDYEVYLAWARFRADVQRGADRDETARRERAVAEESLAGRMPRPRALLALGLLCNATGDPVSARWYLREALAGDPNLTTAKQILARIGG